MGDALAPPGGWDPISAIPVKQPAGRTRRDQARVRQGGRVVTRRALSPGRAIAPPGMHDRTSPFMHPDDASRIPAEQTHRAHFIAAKAKFGETKQSWKCQQYQRFVRAHRVQHERNAFVPEPGI